jgi:hypothetical protein
VRRKSVVAFIKAHVRKCCGVMPRVNSVALNRVRLQPNHQRCFRQMDYTEYCRAYFVKP